MTGPFGDPDFPNGFRELPELTMAEATGTALGMAQELKELKFKLQYTEGREKYWRKLYEELTTQRHHKVFVEVLKALVPQVTYAGRHGNPHASWAEVAATAREVADLAYPPPPKDEP